MTEQELNTIIQSGEGYKIEFKRSVNSDLSKELVAFSNSSGGRIFIGVDDDGTLPGITVDNALKSKVEMMARDCDPSVVISLEVFNKILLIHVPEGQNKPYRCTSGFYLRNGASSVKLSTEEIREFFAAEGKVHFDEMPSSLTYPGGLSEEVIKKYMELSGISNAINQKELLVNLGVVSGGNLAGINNTGILFFTQHPVRYIPQSAVTCVAYKGNVKVDILDKKTFELDIISNIDEAIAFLKRHLNLSYEIKTKKRVEKLEIPEVVLREAIVNAVAHRDYFEKGATVMIEVFDNRLEISSPGGLPKGLKEEDFGKRTLARNPLVAALLNRAGYIEKLGTGIPRIRQSMLEAGLPEPDFKFDSFFTVVLARPSEPPTPHLFGELTVPHEQLERMKFLLQQLVIANKLEVAAAAKKLGTTERTVRRDLMALNKMGWIGIEGSTRNRTYRLTEQALKKLSEK